MLEKTLESPLDCKEIQPVYPKGNQSWISIGRTDAEDEALNTLATWWKELTHLKRLWCWERLKEGGEGTEDEMVGWHHWLNRHEFEQAPGDGEGQGSLACCSPRVAKSWTQLSNWTDWVIWLKSTYWEKSVIISIILESYISQRRKIKTNYLFGTWMNKLMD